MAELNLACLVAVYRCFEEGALKPVLKDYSETEFNRANLECAAAMRSGDMERAREHAYAAKAIENLADDFMHFLERELARAKS